jgi:hypothetical protein
MNIFGAIVSSCRLLFLMEIGTSADEGRLLFALPCAGDFERLSCAGDFERLSCAGDFERLSLSDRLVVAADCIALRKD